LALGIFVGMSRTDHEGCSYSLVTISNPTTTMTTPTNWRALCAELLPLSHSSLCAEEMIDSAIESIQRASAVLAQTEPETLTVQQCSDMPKHWENFIWESPRGGIQLDGYFSREDLLELARTAPASDHL
jgi:hypothetical protein